MLGLFGYAFVVLRLVGVAVIFSALLGALIFHLGWRNEHPSEFWPLRALLGFGGVIVAGFGLFVGSFLAIAAGVLSYFASLLIKPEPRIPV